MDVVKDEMQRIGVTKDDVRIGLDGGTWPPEGEEEKKKNFLILLTTERASDSKSNLTTRFHFNPNLLK